MEEQKQNQTILQWHPAFFACIQVELQEDAGRLFFENEHQLGTKPMEIDVLIIKKEGKEPIHKNIGKIFRKHNLVEYKGPGDYLSIDDFYKVLGYACFYKADVNRVNSIPFEELTISLVSQGYPCRLAEHLIQERGYDIIWKEPGIYYINGAPVPIQLIVTGQLSKKDNLWLGSLTNQLEKRTDAEELIHTYQENKDNKLYRSLMNIIVHANAEKFQEVKTMCEALEELMKDELDAKMNEGEEKVNNLNVKLAEAGRLDEIIKASSDRKLQKKLFQEFGL